MTQTEKKERRKRIESVQDLPEEILEKSETWREYYDVCGVCSACKEWAGALDPCCGASIYHEGGSLHWEDLWDDIEFELSEGEKK
jgi:Fe-S oxidoreductase